MYWQNRREIEECPFYLFKFSTHTVYYDTRISNLKYAIYVFFHLKLIVAGAGLKGFKEY